jgi:integrase
MRRNKRLTTREVLSAKPDRGRRALMLCDGDGLYLQVSRDPKDHNHVRRSWVFRYEYLGRRHDIGLGPLRHLDLAEARKQARKKRQEILTGVDPYSAKQQLRREELDRLAAQKRATTFRQCAEQCIAAHEDGWKNPKHRAQWRTTLQTYANPVLGDLSIDDITTAHIVKVLEPIWKEKPETANRVRGRIEKVLGWATVRGFRSGDNPARWRGHLAELFPAKGKLGKVKHLSALPFSEMPALMAELRTRDLRSARALEFTILTAARTGEVIGATWNEINLIAKTWTIPASRMKAGKEHKVPLCDRAVDVLRGLGEHGDKEKVFALSDTPMLELLKSMRPGITVHGFRSTFRDWASEKGPNYPNHVAEAALAHAVPSKVEAAYRRGDLFEKRRRLMNEWAAWCSRPVPTDGAKVVAIGAGVR